MAGNILIIEFTKDAVRAASPDKESGKLRIYSSAINDGDIEAALTSLTGELHSDGVKDIRRVVMGIDPSFLSIRLIETPFTEKSKIDEIIPLELSDSLIDGIESYVFGSVRLGGSKTLAVAIEKSVVDRHIKMLRAFGLEADWVTSPLFLKDLLLAELSSSDGTEAFLDGTSIAARSGGEAVFYKELSGENDLRLALMSLKEEGFEVGKFYCTEGASLRSGLNKIETDAFVETTEEFKSEETGIEALARKVKDGVTPELDFRTGEFADTRESKAVSSGLKVAAGFVFFLMVLWGVHTHLFSGVLTAEAHGIAENINKAYVELFPADAGSVADPLYQMEAKLNGLRVDSGVMRGSVDVLALMQELSTMKPRPSQISSLSVDKGRLTIDGEVGTTKEVNSFKEALESSSLFTDAVLGKVKEEGKGKVSFMLTAMM
ncbi:MAG: PilN domain-containing protein, partial [Thermodesulfobacteriota bacterium]